jgi:tripartite-type tricarboxylate transporter receptor subunit TctC
MARSGDQPLNYGSAGVGSLQHLGTEQFKLLTQAKITHIPYNGAAPAMQDLLAGRVQLLITTPPTVLQQIQSGHLRGLAITSAKRHPMLPDVPTTAEAGLPEFQLEAWFSIFGPADMPLDIVQKLETAIQAVVTSQSFRDQITKQGSYASYQGAREVAQQVSKDLVRWADVVRRAHIQAE